MEYAKKEKNAIVAHPRFVQTFAKHFALIRKEMTMTVGRILQLYVYFKVLVGVRELLSRSSKPLITTIKRVAYMTLFTIKFAELLL